MSKFCESPGSTQIDETEKRAREQAIIDAYKPICLCNKIRKGIVIKAIQAGATTFAQVSKRTGIGTGPCGATRCGPMVRGMLGEEVETCQDCGWSILREPRPLICPRCSSVQQDRNS